MTVNTNNITSGPYLGTGTSSNFSYDFRVNDESQLSVYETDDDGNQTLLTLTTDYTVAGVGDDGGGIITRVAGNLPTDYEWYIRSNYNDTQLTAFDSQGGFFPDVHEDALDKRTFVSQQQEDKLTRSLRLSDSDSSIESGDMTLPGLADRASQLLGFDIDGNPIAAAGVTGVLVSAFMETVLDDETAAAARITLGVDTELALKLALAGGTMTGDLTLPGDPTDDLHAVPKQYVDALGGLRAKIVEIGDWDMDASGTVNVTHGLDASKIRNIDVIIISDASLYNPLTRGAHSADTTQQGSVLEIGATVFALCRLTGGQFDNALYDLTPFNRGWATITYEE